MKKLTDEGAKIRFPKGNKIPYGQDLSMKRGVPDDIEFTVVSILETEDHRLQLRGPGYGEKDNYGNGAIYVSMRELENIEIEPDETPLEKARRHRTAYMDGRKAIDFRILAAYDAMEAYEAAITRLKASAWTDEDMRKAYDFGNRRACKLMGIGFDDWLKTQSRSGKEAE